MQFNPAKSNVMHIDINSCFATIEQQANPLLRGRPVVVAAFTTPNGCILASSVQAKRLGIKTGMRVREGREIYKNLIVLPSDPDKYRDVHVKLRKLLTDYSLLVIPKSIDEFVLEPVASNLQQVAREVKTRIKKEIGEYITVSIGVSTNRYLAKIAAGLVKPDGLVEIDKNNYLDLYSCLRLTDLTGIKNGIARRLNKIGIYNVMDLYNYKKPFLGCFWGLRLSGYEVDDFKSERKSFSNEVALKLSKDLNVSPIVARLFEKAKFRTRQSGFRAEEKHVEVSDHKILVTLYRLTSISNLQLDFFDRNIRKENLEQAVYKINNKWGSFVVGSARSFGNKNLVLDRISFGQVPDL